MLNTKFNVKELTSICQILKSHGTDCKTLVEILELANSASPNDAGSTYKHIRLLKEFGILKDENIKCHMCIMKVIDLHAETCELYKTRTDYLPCPDDHYNYSKCLSAEWMVDSQKIHDLEHEAAEKDWNEGRRDNIRLDYGFPIFDGDKIIGHEKEARRFDHTGRTNWLAATFPDILEDVRFNPFMGFLCDKHIGSMKPYANKIIDYK